MRYYITGTDTEAGKTVVTGLLSRYLAEKGVRVVTQKWIQTGADEGGDDLLRHIELMGKKKEDFEEYSGDMIPYTFRRPVSPHLAARTEKRSIETENIIESYKRLSCSFDAVLVESSGGLLVPYDERSLMIDIARKLSIPAVIVSANRLGAINHTLMTIECLRNRDMNIAGVIFNNVSPKKNDRLLKEDNIDIIEKLSGVRILGSIPYEDEPEKLFAAIEPAARKLFEQEGEHEQTG
jgi:dethiobiotin synthetase